MREYRQFEERRATAPEYLVKERYEAVLIATDHDSVDYESLIHLGCPVIDTRNAIERRGLVCDLLFKV
jgi:UDP-N-acetyl-D-glucosamine dehydrogenase